MSDGLHDPPFEDEDAEEAAPPSPNAADAGSHKRIRNRAKRERAEAAAFWGSVFASEVGRREMWGMLDACHTFRKRFGAGPNGTAQPEATDYYDGERDVGQRLWLSWLAICPDGVLLMMKEHHPQLRPPPKPRRTRQDE